MPSAAQFRKLADSGCTAKAEPGGSWAGACVSWKTMSLSLDRPSTRPQGSNALVPIVILPKLGRMFLFHKEVSKIIERWVIGYALHKSPVLSQG